MKKKKLENPHLANKVGTTSYLKVHWKSWKEIPPQGEKIFVIVKLANGYYPLFAEYMEWTSEKPDVYTYRYVRFDHISMPEIYLGSKNEKRLIAWGFMEDHKMPLTIDVESSQVNGQ